MRAPAHGEGDPQAWEVQHDGAYDKSILRTQKCTQHNWKDVTILPYVYVTLPNLKH